MIKNNDFIALEFTGTITGTSEVFDTNIKEDAKKAKFDLKDIKPFEMCVGHKMLPSGFDEDLVNKEIGKSYTVTIKPEKAFGKRNANLVRMIPTKLFHAQQIDPQKGMQLALDGQLVKVLSNSGGRTLVDFNNPLAGKEVTYHYTIVKKIDDKKEQINALQDFLFRKRFDFEQTDKKITFKVEKNMEPFVKLMAKKFEEILGLSVDATIVEAKKEEKDKKKEESHEHSTHDHEGHDHTHHKH